MQALTQANSKETSSPIAAVAKWIALLTAAAALWLCVRLPLQFTDQVLLSTLLVLGSICLTRFSSSRAATLTLTVVSLFCTFRYAFWRWDSTLSYLNNNGWQVDAWGLFFAFMLLGAEAYAVLVLVLGFFQSARPLTRRPIPLPDNPEEWPSVDVFIPTYNEPLEVVRPTVLAALGIDWPQDRLRVYILDDGRRSQFEQFADECGASYITRDDNSHAKAGNINNAISKTSGEYVAIFDCDHIATRSFLQMTMGWFLKDSKLGLVQTPHHFYSPDPFERNLGVFRRVPNEGALFYGIVQEGSDLWNASFFCGSCAVLRRTALEQIGGIAVETVTEDAHTSLRMQRHGWNTAYIGIPQAAGLATGSLAAHIGQRIRWARGMVQILRTDCPLFASGLNLAQRLCYLNSVIHYLYAIPRLVFLTAPLVYLVLGKSNLYGYLWEIVAYALPHLILATITNSRIQGKHRHSFWNEVYEAVLAPYIALPTTLALINPKWGKFNVTSKSSVVEERYFDFKVARPYLVLIALNFIGLGMAIPRFMAQGDPNGVLTVNVFWAALNTLILGTAIAVSIEDRQRRSNVRISTNMPVRVILPTGNAYDCRLIDISEGGLALRPQKDLQLRPGTQVDALVSSPDGDQTFPVQVIQASKAAVRLQFTSPDLEQQRALTRVVYSRADSWLNWTEGQNHDRILSSLFEILGIGMKGLLSIPGALFNHVRQSSNESKLAQVGQAITPLILFALLIFAALSARGEQPAPRGFHDEQDLLALGQPGGFTLKGADVQYVLPFGIQGTKVVSSGALTLDLRASSQALSAGSLLDVTFNGSNVASLSLHELQANSAGLLRSEIPLPADLFVTDNSLAFHFHAPCMQPCNEGLKADRWLRVEASTKLEMSGVLLALPNQLRILPSPFFDASFHRTLQLPIVFAGSPDLPALQAAGLVASWYGVLADFRGSHFPVSIGEIPHGNVVLLGIADSPLIAQFGIPISGSTLAVRDNPSDPYSKVLVVAGRNADQVLNAARALALGQFSSDSDTTDVSQVTMSAPRIAYDAPRWLQSGAPLKLAERAPAGLLTAGGGNSARLYFRLAPDLYFGSRTSVPLHLFYRIAGVPVGSKGYIHIKLNGIPVLSREVRAGSSDLQTQSFAIPTSLLYASNTLLIDFAPASTASANSDGSLAQLVVGRGTELDLGAAPHFVRMPRMDLFANSGFPFTRFADLSRTAMILPNEPTRSEIALYLDSLGFLSAQTGYPSLKVSVVSAKQADNLRDKDLLVIGSGHDQPLFAQWANALPVQIGDDHFSLNRVAFSPLEWLDRFSFFGRDKRAEAADLLEADGRATAVLEELPAGPERTAVVLATSSPDVERPVLAMLSSASMQGRVKGDVAALVEGRFHSLELRSKSSYLGVANWYTALEFWMTLHVWFIPLLVVLCAYIVGTRWESYLERVAAKRLETAS